MRHLIYCIIGLCITTFACESSIKKTTSVKTDDLSSKTYIENLQDSIETIFKVEILDDEALQVIDKDTEIEVMARGFTWVEGPLWIESEQFFIFSDIPNNKIYKLQSNGDTSTYLLPSGMDINSTTPNPVGSNGLVLSNDNELVLMQHGDRRVAKMDALVSSPRPKYSVLADKYQDKRLNSPNDGAYDKLGNLYFTDPPYGLKELDKDPNKELPHQGVYCLKTNGDLILLDTLTKPNGLALNADNTKMYVAVSDFTHAVWYEYDLTSPGKVANKKIFYDVTHLAGQKGQQGMPDGLKVNDEGYIFATGAGGLWIFNPKGKPLARVYTGQLTSNCALTADHKRLYMTADDFILSIKLK